MLTKEFIEKGSKWLAFVNLGGHCDHQIQHEEFSSIVICYFNELLREGIEVDSEIKHWQNKIINGDNFSINEIKKNLPWL